MTEFRKLFELPAAKLSRVDVESLAKVITDGVPTSREDFDFSLSKGEEIYRASSIEELLSQKLPSSIDGLLFRVIGWTDNHKIDRSVEIHLRRTTTMCQIHALDEIWFKGKIEQIYEFFRKRSPWYGKFTNIISYVFGGMEAASFCATLFFLIEREFLLSLVSGLTLVALVIGWRGYLSGRLFPLADVRLTAEAPLISRQRLTFLMMVIGTIATVAGVVVQVVSKINF